MNMLILNAGQLDALAALNESGDQHRQIFAEPLINGFGGLSADLLEDAGPDQTWEHYGEFLQTLPQRGVALEEFVQPEIV